MIDTDKMRAAYAATPLCQRAWTERGDEAHTPTKLCAVSAMVSYAGVQPALIATIDEAYSGDEWVRILAEPVLWAEYGVPKYLVRQIVKIFDGAENEWRGVQDVLALCEAYNIDLRYAEARDEDRERFPQHTCEPRVGHITFTQLDHMFSKINGNSLTISACDPATVGGDWSAPIPLWDAPPPSVPGSHKTPTHSATGQSKFWTPSSGLAITKKYAGNLLVNP